jgi:hypothetical protein
MMHSFSSEGPPYQTAISLRATYLRLNKEYPGSSLLLLVRTLELFCIEIRMEFFKYLSCKYFENEKKNVNEDTYIIKSGVT